MIEFNEQVTLNANANPILDANANLNANPILDANANLNANPILDANANLNANPILDANANLNANPILDANANLNANPILDANHFLELVGKHIDTKSEINEPRAISTVHIMQFCAGSVIINVRYYEEKKLYKILISKSGEYFFPKETKLEASTCEYLCQLLEIEFRGEELQYFVGFENRRRFKRVIEEIPKYFADCP